MGASESTPTTNGTNQDEERKQESGGGSMGRLKTAAVASIAVVGVAALAISKMHSDNSSTSSHLGYTSRDQTYPIDRVLPSPRRPYIMYTDGNFQPNKGGSGFGGILRDDRGKWVRGFIGFMDSNDNFIGKIHGIYNGLLLLDKLGLKGSTLICDDQAATTWVRVESNTFPSRSKVINVWWKIIIECRHLIRKNDIIISCCSIKEGADKLVEMAVEKQEPFMDIMDDPNEQAYH